MDRLLTLYRTTSSAGAVASLVVANLVPLIGVLFFGWHLWTILALYWVENGIVGLYNIAKILLAEGSQTAEAGSRGFRVIHNGQTVGPLTRTATALFFVVHYGLFWLVHGIFVLVALPGFAEATAATPAVAVLGSGEVDPSWPGIQARMDQVVVGAIGLAISHGVSFWLNFLGRGEYRRVSPLIQMGAPYGRLVVLHLAILVGAVVSTFIGTPLGALLVLVGLKLALDLRFHLREHASVGPGGAPGEGGNS